MLNTKIVKSYNSHYFYRIVFTFLIVLSHSGFWDNETSSLYIGVDYFFIISGFFIAQSAEQKKISPLHYMFLRVKKLYPHVILSFLLLAFIECGLHPFSIFKTCVLHLPEIVPGAYFLTDYSITNSFPYNFPTWYLTPLLLVGGATYGLITKNHKLYLAFAPLIASLCYQAIVYSGPSFNNGTGLGIWANGYNLRAIAGIFGGSILYYAIRLFDTTKFNKLFFICIRCAEMAMLALVIYFIFYLGNSKKDIIIVILLYFLIMLGFIYKETVKRKVHSAIIYLSSLMYPVYLNHTFVLRFLEKTDLKCHITRNGPVCAIVITFLFIIIWSIFTQKLLKLITCIVNRIKILFIL